MNFQKILKVGVATASLLSAAAVNAAYVPLPANGGYLEDDNIEYLLDAQGNIKTSGQIEIGDRLRAVITFQNARDSQDNIHANFSFGGLEVTGISEIEVKGFATDPLSGASMLIMGPSASFEAEYGAGAVAALFSQRPGDFTIACHNVGISECETTATNGEAFFTAGFEDEDDFWVATGGVGMDVSMVAQIGSATNFASANFALSILENNTGFEFREMNSIVSQFYTTGGDLMTDITGGGTLLGGAGLQNGYFARSDFDFSFDRIPEPATLAVVGLGLLAMGARRRKA